ncbi:ABC transporter permease [Aminobacter sp. MSH1]|uniref:ABC transporter permease n=1 Tax=Aminobacter sp. MSH1 TaxID=374606 RepID=UPI001FE02F5B|nr:ABC transporter permease [Aminobacter sp. MSH1]
MSFVTRRIVQMGFTLVVVVFANFLLLHAAPGDVIDVLATESQVGDPAQLAEMRERLGLDQPLVVQLMRYYVSLAQLDFGRSGRSNRPVLDMIAERLPATMLLMVSSVLLSLAVGALLGTIAATRVHSATDTAISTLAMIMYATPSFLAGLLLILIFSIGLRWLPLIGMTTVGVELTGAAYVWDVFTHLIMPVVTLSFIYVGVYTRLMRASLLEILTLDHIRTARAKGLSRSAITRNHAMRNAFSPMIVMCGLQVGSVFGGAVVVETIFGWPGMGLLAYNAVFQRDYVLLLGILFMSAVIVLVTSLLVDLVLMWLDPRVRLK